MGPYWVCYTLKIIRYSDEERKHMYIRRWWNQTSGNASLFKQSDDTVHINVEIRKPTGRIRRI